jgi:outer membrane immunogenic protein
MKFTAKAGWSLAGLLCAAFAPAMAADLPSYKDPLPPPPALAAAPANFTGFYLGGFAGGTSGSAAQSYSVDSTWISANLPPLIPYLANAGSQGLGLRGADLGVEAGYGWKVAPNTIVGVYGDIGWSNLSGSRQTTGVFPIIPIPYQIDQKLSSDWRGSLRVKAGFTPVDNLMIYGTGGLAFGHFNYSVGFWDSLVPPFLPGNEFNSATFNAMRWGWTLGGGLEWAFAQNWSVGGEYRYTQYQSISGVSELQLQQPVSTAFISHSARAIGLNSLRVGIGYHFN